MFDMWLKETAISFWAHRYCIYIEDDEKVRNYITLSSHSYAYCLFKKDRPEIRKNINRPVEAYIYKIKVRNDIEWINNLAKRY